MKTLVTIILVVLVLMSVVPAYAECKNEPAWLKTFPDRWTLKWEYRFGELTVREYRSPDNWLGIYYRIDYLPARIEEALLTEEPGKTDFSSGMPHTVFGERHALMRLVKPRDGFHGVYDYECWREVYGFEVQIDTKIGEPGVWFSIKKINKF